jgi:hypothetical protein
MDPADGLAELPGPVAVAPSRKASSSAATRATTIPTAPARTHRPAATVPQAGSSWAGRTSGNRTVGFEPNNLLEQTAAAHWRAKVGSQSSRRCCSAWPFAKKTLWLPDTAKTLLHSPDVARTLGTLHAAELRYGVGLVVQHASPGRSRPELATDPPDVACPLMRHAHGPEVQSTSVRRP